MDLSLYAHIGYGILCMIALAMLLSLICVSVIARQQHDQAPISWVEAVFKALTQRR